MLVWRTQLYRKDNNTHIDRADEVLGSHHEVAEQHAENDSHDPSANKAFHGLLGRKLDELGATKGNTADVCPDIVGDDESGGEEEPDHAFKDVVHDEVGLDDDQVEGHVRPRKVGELELVVAGLERGDEEDEAEDIENEADEAVVVGKRQQDLVDEHNVLEVVDDALAVEEVHCRGQPVPVEALGGLEGTGAAGDVGNGNDLFEGDDLDGGDNGDDVDVAHEEGNEEAGNHDQGPNGACPKVGLFLFIFGFLVFGSRWFLEEQKKKVSAFRSSTGPSQSMIT